MPHDPATDQPTPLATDPSWWDGSVIYQIYPRSFADANGDGVGDLAGIRARLDHVAQLGADAIWLSPFYRSPMADFGYDVSDHCGVEPVFGTLDDADALIADAHALGLRVIVDFVPNHTSDRHPWFVASRSSRDDPHRNWYFWRDSGPDGRPPNNWRARFTGEIGWHHDDDGQLRPRWDQPQTDPSASTSAWTWDDATGQWYLHTFLPEQPDLDWRNPSVVAAQHDVLRFWLDRGVDGFRIDAIITLGKPLGLPDVAPELELIPESGLTDGDFTRAMVNEIRRLVESHRADGVIIGEVAGIDLTSIREFVSDDHFHLAFTFPPMVDRWAADRWRHHIDVAERDHLGQPGPAWVLSNHDLPRHAERYGTEARARAAAVLLVGLRGTVVLYAGEELGLLDAEVPPARQLDPGLRDGCRAPIPWTAAPDHGWGPEPWLPFPRNAATHHADAQAADPGSVLHLYRRLIACRHASPALRQGAFAWLDAPDGVLAWRRLADADERIVAVSFVAQDRELDLPAGAWVLEVSSAGDGTEAGRSWTGALGPDEAVIARRA